MGTRIPLLLFVFSIALACPLDLEAISQNSSGAAPHSSSPHGDSESSADKAPARPERHYYIAAEPVEWSYAPGNRDRVKDWMLPPPWTTANHKYSKYHFVAYSDDTFTTVVKQPAWIGLLGPVLRGAVGDRLIVTLFNRTDRVVSIHPHGVHYDKDSEGAYYYPNPGKGSWVTSQQKFTYLWDINDDAGPREGDPSSRVWLYHSHIMADTDINLGLVGPLIVTSRNHARPDGSPDDVDREFVTLFLIFNENQGLERDFDMGDMDPDDENPEVRHKREEFAKLSPAKQQEMLESGLMHAINGYIFGNVPGLEMVKGERVRWYVMALGSERDFHSVHWHGQTVLEDGRRRTDVVELLPGSMKVVDFRADNPGTWMVQCHVADHMMSGMYALYTVRESGSPQ